MRETQKVSCLCVTNGIFEHLVQAIECFEKQTYPERELVVVDNGLDYLGVLLRTKSLSNPNISWFSLPDREQTLGELRNEAVERAVGDYVMQWDDDDWHHPKRVELMVKHLEDRDADAVLLRQWLMHDTIGRRYYLSFDRPHGWEGSMLCKREAALKIRYPAVRLGEDRQFMSRLQTNYNVVCLSDLYWLYLYRYSGSNSWDRGHFERIFKQSMEFPSDIVKGMLAQ